MVRYGTWKPAKSRLPTTNQQPTQIAAGPPVSACGTQNIATMAAPSSTPVRIIRRR